MTDDIWNRAEIESPCVKLCVIHPRAGLCVGCFRTLEEIATWSTLPAAERQALMQTLPTRATQIKPKRAGGRAARKTSPGPLGGNTD